MSDQVEKFRMTARELLERVGGKEHAQHSVARKHTSVRKRSTSATIEFTCTCGEEFEVGATPENKAALRNVVEKSS